jgi:hypothetical protein
VRDEWVDEVRKILDDDGISGFLAAGQAMTTDQAVAYALQLQELAATDAKRDAWSPLKEVAKLVARGFTNRQIASELAVTEATAAKHVENIREKGWAQLSHTSRNVGARARNSRGTARELNALGRWAFWCLPSQAVSGTRCMPLGGRLRRR